MTDFYHLSPLEQQAHLQEFARKSLSAWGLEGELSLIKARENTVYSVITTSGKRYALRVHRADYHSDASLRSEMNWIHKLEEAGVGVPSILPTKSGEYFAVVATGDVPEPRQVDLLGWVSGEQIGSVKEGLGSDPQAIGNSYRTIGRVAAQVHNQSSSWTLPEGFERHSWDIEGLVGEQPLWGRFWEMVALSKEQRELLITARDFIRQDLLEFGQTPQDFSLIHADFVPENILADGDKVQIIDFDDAGFGWHMFELATALYFIQQDEHYRIAKDALIEGYRELRELSDEKLEKLPLFMAARSLTYIGWVHTRQGTETAIELTPYLVELCVATLNDYLGSR